MPVPVRKHTRRKPRLAPLRRYPPPSTWGTSARAGGTRHIFGGLTSRKTEWEQMSSYEWDYFTPEEKKALLGLPRKVWRPRDSIYAGRFREGRGPLEWIVERAGQFYYVNTEGFHYARYGFHIRGFPGSKYTRGFPRA